MMSQFINIRIFRFSPLSFSFFILRFLILPLSSQFLTSSCHFPHFYRPSYLPIIIPVKGLHFFLLKFILPFEFLSFNNFLRPFHSSLPRKARTSFDMAFLPSSSPPHSLFFDKQLLLCLYCQHSLLVFTKQTKQKLHQMLFATTAVSLRSLCMSTD